jgi:hypothetical protein
MAVSIGTASDTARRAGGEARFSLFFRDERKELRDERGEKEVRRQEVGSQETRTDAES